MLLDVFNDDAFSLAPLSIAMQDIIYVPGRIGELGLFTESSVSTTSIILEQRSNIVELIEPTPRGGPGSTIGNTKRKMRALAIPHFQIDDAIMAESVQGVRAFGTESELEMAMDKVTERGVIARQSFEFTHEHARLGALRGNVIYKGGDSLNLFQALGVQQIAEIDFDLDNANPAAGALRKVCSGVHQTIADELGGIPFSGVRALCGMQFFEELINHPEVREIYLASYLRAQELATSYVRANGGQSSKIYATFVYGDITWEVYRGKASVDGNAAVDMVNTHKAHIFPEGVPGLFQTVFAPADYWETVNTQGRPIYAKSWLMPNDKGLSLEWQTNPLHFCTRPRVLLTGKRT
jgi:hypothetical protein